MKPADCIDQVSADKLNEQGVGKGGDSITVQPNVVVLSIDNGRTVVRIPMSKFKVFAEWYLEDQTID